MTSNIGSQKLINHSEKEVSGKTVQADQKKLIIHELKKHFRPEFLNRIDDTVVFHPLQKEHMKGIIKIQLERLKKRLYERNILLTLAAKTIDFLTESGFDPVYGARPLKRSIQKELETALARAVLSGEIKDGQNIIANLVDGQIVFNLKSLRSSDD